MIFQEATGTTLTDDNFKDTRPGNGWNQKPLLKEHNKKKDVETANDKNKREKQEKIDRKSWCGIFCVFCYRRAGLTSLRWDIALGSPVGPVQLTSWTPQFVANIKLADIGVITEQYHHFLIEKVDTKNPFKPPMVTIEGNTAHGRIVRKVNVRKVGLGGFNYYSFK